MLAKANYSGTSGHNLFDNTALGYQLYLSANATGTSGAGKGLMFRGGSESAPYVLDGKGFSYTITSGNENNTKFYIGEDSTDGCLLFYNGTIACGYFKMGKTGTSSGWLKLGNGTDDTTLTETAQNVNFYNNSRLVADKAKIDFGSKSVTFNDMSNAYLTNATLKSGAMTVASGAGNSCAIEKNGGDWSVSGLYLGKGQGSTVNFRQLDGDLVSSTYITVGQNATDCDAYMEVSGGTVKNTNKYLSIADYGSASTTAKAVFKGTGAYEGPGVIVGQRGSAELVVQDSASLTMSEALFFCNANDNAPGTPAVFNFDGGSVTTPTVKYGAGSGTATFNFNGGKLVASAAGTLVQKADNLSVKVCANGGTIDSHGKAVTIAEDLESGAASGETDGGMTFAGAGTVTLTGTVSYNGPTTIEGATKLIVPSAESAGVFENGLKIRATDAGIPDGTVVFTVDGGTIAEAQCATVTFEGTLSECYTASLNGTSDSIVVNFAPPALVWNDGDSAASWRATGKWTHGVDSMDWIDLADATFDADGDAATVDSAVTATKATFNGDVSISGTATLTLSSAEVASGKTATVSAPTAGTLEKTGAGTLTLGTSRTEQTTVSEGTLAMASGATLDATKLTLGTDAAKSVALDYGGQTLEANPTSYLGYSAQTTLSNGTFLHTANTALRDTNFLPSVLNIENGAVLTNSVRFSYNTDNVRTINVNGGTLAHGTTNDTSWIMQASTNGVYNFNVKDGLLSFGSDIYALTCRDKVDGSYAYYSPELHFSLADSTLRITSSGKSFNCGWDSSNKNPVSPVFTLAMTNSVLDIPGGALRIGHSATGANTAGSYTADFDDCVITARYVQVYKDRPANAIRFDGVEYTLTADSDTYYLQTDSAFDTMGENGGAIKPMSVGTKGLTLNTQTYIGALNADLDGSGTVTKTGSGTLLVKKSQTTATVPLAISEGSATLSSGVSVAGAVSVADGATLTPDSAGNTLGSLSVASGGIVAIPALSSSTAAITASSFTFDSGAIVALPAGTILPGTYPLFALASGEFDADAADGISLDSSLRATLSVSGGTISVTVTQYSVGNKGMTSLAVGDDTLVTGAGGVKLSSLAFSATSKLTYDPIFTPVFVSKTPTFATGAKIALSSDYSGVSCGRIVLMTYSGSATFDPSLFDSTSIASGATYTLTEESSPDGDYNQLVLTVGDYDSAPSIRVMPIGDSITQGVTKDKQGDYPQYRTGIAALLAANGYRPDFKGIWRFAQYDAAGVRQPGSYRWHCGISGDGIKTASERGGVRDNIHLYLDVAGEPDVITLLIGTNDIGAGGETASATFDMYTNLVETIATQRPSAKIVGATLLDRNGSSSANHAKVVEFNTLLKAAVAADEMPSNYVLLDLFEAVSLGSETFFTDQLHMNWAGCALASKAFAAKIMETLPLTSFSGTTDSTATDDAQTALGAAETIPSDYRAGMMHVFTLDAANAGNVFYGSAPYTATNAAVSLTREITKAGYYMELVRNGSNRRRYVWVDFDATGKTLDEIDWPWTGSKFQQVVANLHVYSNDFGIKNIAAGATGYKGIVEATSANYTKTDALSSAPADIMTLGWNDALTDSGAGYGCFQAHRIFTQEGEDKHWNDAQVLFAWNRWGKSSEADEIGIGDYSCHANGVGNTMDYTWTADKGTDGLPGNVSAEGYQVRHLEIWVEPAVRTGTVFMIR